MFPEHGRHRLLLAAVAALALALLAACSGDDASPLTAAEAKAISDEALLVVADLPEADWDQQESQASLEGLVPGGAGDVNLDILPEACQSLENALGDLPALLGDVTPLSSSSRTFTTTGQLLNLDAVSSSVVVFESADDAETAAATLNDALSADNLEGCVSSAFGSAGTEGLRIVEFTITTPDYALDDSTALTVNIDAIALILPVNLTLDLHAFQRDNVLGLYAGLEVNSDTLEAEHAGLLATFANHIEEAQAAAR